MIENDEWDIIKYLQMEVLRDVTKITEKIIEHIKGRDEASSYLLACLRLSWFLFMQAYKSKSPRSFFYWKNK